MSDTEEIESESETLREQISWRRIASVAGFLLLIAIVIPFVIYTVPQVVGGDSSYMVLSGSMEPSISAGDVIVTHRVETGNIKSGDVITFQRSGDRRPTTHRVIEVVGQEGSPEFRTQGDANEDPDQQLVSADAVSGKVLTVGGYLFVIPYLGYVIQFAGTQIGFVALLVVPLVLLVISEIWEAAKSARTDSTVERTEGDATASNGPTESAAGAADDGESADNENDAQMTFTAAELQLALLVLGCFVIYSLWVTYATMEIWAFAVAGSVATAFLLLGSVYVVGGDNEDAEATDSGVDTDTEDRVDDEAPALEPEKVGVLSQDIELSQTGDHNSLSSSEAGLASMRDAGASGRENGDPTATAEETVEGESDD